MNRFFIRERSKEHDRVYERRKIGVLGLGRETGASFIATSLAKELSLVEKRQVAYIEVRRGGGAPNSMGRSGERPRLLYDALGMDRRFSGREFVSIRREISGGGKIGAIKNMDERINWALETPEDVSEGLELTEAGAMRLVNNIAADAVVCDISELSPYRDLVKDMSLLVVTIDPMPSKLLSRERELAYLRELSEGLSTVFVVNKMNRGVLKRELDAFLRVKDYETLPILPQELFYRAEYACALPYSVKEIREAAGQLIEKILRRI